MIPFLDRRTAPVIALDWDGTVVDSVPYKLAQNKAIAHEFGNELTIDEVRREWNAANGFPDLMHRLTGSGDMAKIMEVVKRDYDNPAYAKREFAFAKAALAMLRAKGYQLAVITNATREILQMDAQDLGFNLGRDFDFTQAADECEFKKPDARVLAPLYNHFGIAAQQLIYVGDEMKDYAITVNAGTLFTGVTTGMSTAEEFDAEGAPYVQNIAVLAQRLPVLNK